MINKCKICGTELPERVKGTYGRQRFYCGLSHEKGSCAWKAKMIRLREDKKTNKRHAKFHEYKCSAKRRNIEFLLSEDEFSQYWEKECFYCGNKMVNAIGLDRMNRLKGYSKDNVVPCCSKCNYTKGAIEVGIDKGGKDRVLKMVHFLVGMQ